MQGLVGAQDLPLCGCLVAVSSRQEHRAGQDKGRAVRHKSVPES